MQNNFISLDLFLFAIFLFFLFFALEIILNSKYSKEKWPNLYKAYQDSKEKYKYSNLKQWFRGNVLMNYSYEFDNKNWFLKILFLMFILLLFFWLLSFLLNT